MARLPRSSLMIIVLVAAACAAPPAKEATPLVAKRNFNASIAGQTLTCAVDGPASALVFSNDGKITGRLMSADASGSWYARNAGEVEVYLDAGAISIRDVLKGSGSSWAGRNIRCR